MNINSIQGFGQIGASADVHSQEFKAKFQSEQNELKSFETALKKAQDSKDKQALKKAAADLEQIFLSMMFKTMKNSIPKAGLLEESSQRKIFEDMMYEEYAGQMAKAGGIGLCDMILKDFERRESQKVLDE